MGFAEFLGNERIVSALRGMFRKERAPSAHAFHRVLAASGNTRWRGCLRRPRIANASPTIFAASAPPAFASAHWPIPTPLIEAGLTERGESADASMVERMPLIVETHPDVWLIVPDPVRLRTPVARPMIRVSQLRAIQRAAYFKPQGRRRVFILDGADTMRWNDADLLLKILEEPPESATLILLAAAPDSLLPTIRSRCLQFHFAPVPAERIEAFLTERTRAKPAERKLAAQLSGGSPGAALSIDLEESSRLRRSILRLLEQAVTGQKYGEIFAATAQLAKRERESFENILALFYSLLTDLLESSQSPASSVLRNPDLRKEIEALGKKIDWHWLVSSHSWFRHDRRPFAPQYRPPVEP